ncbi:MAG: PhnD/SsuA/transferrin family substrate-binding protein, partial [Gammaproteobacteria bacterium]|nr:PhnD/SsuA/transferrin family substrate-binding protein [Gammaproteobacteria bacterium]
KLNVASNYEQGIENLIKGQVDFGRMGPASYVLSKNRNPDLRIIAMESKKGRKVFYGIICVQDKSDIESLGQLQGKSFAFGNERSTIGRYLSQHLLAESGVYADDLLDYRYLGRHDRVGSAVGAGEFDAGALKESTFKKLKAQGVKIRELARFPNVTKPWIASSKLDPEVFTALQEVLLSIKDASVLKALKKQGFLLAQDSDYASIRSSMLNNHEFFQ